MLMKMAVVGLGYWGPNIVRNFSDSEQVESVLCFDSDPQRMEKTARKLPRTRSAKSFEDVLASDVHGVAIVTPTSHHYALARKALEAGKHVLVEKPLAMTSEECASLIAIAQDRKLILMVDHTFVYTGAVRKMKEIVSQGDIGDLYYFDSVRVNLGLLQHDVNVLWDLAPHDLSIMSYLLDQKPTAVSAVGISHYNHQEDIAYMTVHFGERLLAHIHVNWLAPVKVRRILIGGSKKMIVYDDTESIEKVRVYDSGVQMVSREGIYRTLVEYRTGDMSAPKLDNTEALSLVVADFINAIRTGIPPVSDGLSGLEVVRILEASQLSIKNQGALVNLTDGTIESPYEHVTKNRT